MIDDLLQKTSRTFALTIPLLREPIRREVGIAYLLFRIADTIEDATAWPKERKVRELLDLAALVESAAGKEWESSADELARRWGATPPIAHAGYRELLASFGYVGNAMHALPDEARSLVTAHTARTCRAMAHFVERETREGGIRLRDIDDLKLYCYAVAGIVGEMLTELFLLNEPRLEGVAADLRRESVVFGEALQLVNILKDSADDLVEGRTYLPPTASRAEILALARRDRVGAAGYCTTLEEAGADEGLLGFTALPVLLAKATLDRVQEEGPGVKITRAEVSAIISALQDALGRREVAELLWKTLATVPV